MWSTTNATSLTRVCSASGTGFTSNGAMVLNDAAGGTASAAWVNYPSTCIWTATGAGGTATATETMRTEPATAVGGVVYIHTDGLGSPVVRTDGAGGVVSRTRYEPYGYVASGATPTIGFTGHVNDGDTGLTYMQQRYYDPVAGRFLSDDPVVADARTGSGFNRYVYANNNPYKYIDPDGRNPAALPAAAGGTAVCGPICGGIAVGIVLGGPYAGKKAVDWWNARSETKLNESSEVPQSDNKNNETPSAPVPDATGGERIGKGPRIWNKPSPDPVGEANRDFDRKFPNGENVDDKGNGVRVGTLPDGKRVIVRPDSSGRSENVPTIEIQNSAGTKSLDKIRYPEN